MKTLQKGASNRLDGIFTRTGLHEVLEEKHYRSLRKMFPFVAAFIDKSTECKKTEPITRVLTGSSETVPDLTRKMGQ